MDSDGTDFSLGAGTHEFHGEVLVFLGKLDERYELRVVLATLVFSIGEVNEKVFLGAVAQGRVFGQERRRIFHGAVALENRE